MQPGQVSDLIAFDANDFTILRLTSHNPAGLQKFDTIKDVLRGNLAKEKNEQLRSALATRLSKNAGSKRRNEGLARAQWRSFENRNARASGNTHRHFSSQLFDVIVGSVQGIGRRFRRIFKDDPDSFPGSVNSPPPELRSPKKRAENGRVHEFFRTLQRALFRF